MRKNSRGTTCSEPARPRAQSRSSKVRSAEEIVHRDVEKVRKFHEIRSARFAAVGFPITDYGSAGIDERQTAADVRHGRTSDRKHTEGVKAD